MKKNYFTTGEFAKICNVSKQTLFFYDNQGIFSPEFTGENGYRYYSYTQIEAFTVIVMLRDLGVHISEIKAHMNHPSPHALIELMESKKTEIDNKIKALQWSKRYIDNRIKITNEGINAVPGIISIQEFPERCMITSDYLGEDDTVAVTQAIGDHLDRCSELGLYNACPIGSIIPSASVTADGYKYSKFYTVVEGSASLKEIVIASGGPHLVLYDEHGYENIGQNCLKLIDYAKENDLKLGESFFEDVLLDDLSTEGYFNYLVKLSIKICP